jgi:hypothetical protein
MIANCPAQHRVGRFKRIKHYALGDWPFNLELHLSRDLGEMAQMGW